MAALKKYEVESTAPGSVMFLGGGFLLYLQAVILNYAKQRVRCTLIP